MKKKLVRTALSACMLLICILLVACSASKSMDADKASPTQAMDTATTLSTADVVSTTSQTDESVVTTTVSSAITSTTTVTKKAENPTTTVTNPMTTVPTTRMTVPPSTVLEAEESFTFPYESEDYTVFRQYVAKYFPDEKHFDSFRVRKIDTTNKKYKGYRIVFNRWINGCETDSFYIFYFDTEGKFVEVSYRSFKYDASKVKPPRVATEAEIEAAKRAEAEKVPDGMVVWEQRVSDSSYSIYADANDFTVTTIYVTQGNYNLYNNPDYEYYGSTPPHAALIETYTIPR